MTQPQPRTRTLLPGVEVPFLGFGTFLIPDEEVADAVESALQVGYRHVDTAEVYQNERGVGEGIRRALDDGLSRDELFVTTKLWPEAGDGTYKTAEQTTAAIDESLRKLGLDYVDLYLIHAPFNREQRLAQWGAIVEAHKAGKARAIGVSNFNVSHIQEIIEAGLQVPHADQVELHPWSQKPVLVEFLNEHGVVPIAYSSLVPLSTWRTAPGHSSGKTETMQADSQKSPFKTLAAKYGVSEAQFLLRWGIENGFPVLPKSTKVERQRQNADLFSFSISESDLAAIKQMDRGQGVAWGADDPTHAG